MSAKNVRRYDRTGFRKAEITSQGFLRAPAYATRIGVLKYRDKDGKVIAELRPPEEVFNADSMRTLANVPMTNQHPAEGFVNASNAKALSVGYTGDQVERIEDKFVQIFATVIDKATISEVERGMQELSCGYECELDPTPGVYEGEHYDAIQRNIVYNHLAIVPRGRAGAEVKLHLDAGDAVLVNGNDENKEADKMAKMKIGDKEFDVHPELAEAFGAHQKDMDAKMAGMAQMQAAHDAMKKEMDAMKATHPETKDVPGQPVGMDAAGKPMVPPPAAAAAPAAAPAEADKTAMAAMAKEKDAMQAKCDALESEIKKLKESRTDSMDETTLKALVAARIKVLAVAGRMLPTAVKLDEMSDLEIKKEIIKADSPESALDGKTADYINARYDHIEERLGAVAANRRELGTAIVHARKDAGTPDADAARMKMIEDNKAAWTKPIGSSVTK
jgi:hypothetical protein